MLRLRCRLAVCRHCYSPVADRVSVYGATGFARAIGWRLSVGIWHLPRLAIYGSRSVATAGDRRYRMDGSAALAARAARRACRRSICLDEHEPSKLAQARRVGRHPGGDNAMGDRNLRRRHARPVGPERSQDDIARDYVERWILATLAALVYDSGATFLFSSATGHFSKAGDRAGTSYLLAKAASSAMAIAGAVWLGRCWPTLRAPRYAFGAVILAIMSWLMAGLGAALLVLAVCVGSGRWRLAVAGAVAASWIVGTFYYQMAVPLATKAAIMAAIGSAFGVSAWLSWNAHADDFVDKAPSVPASAAIADAEPAQLAGIVASLLLTLLVANGAIWQKETLIRTGRPVFIALAPVDPRSSMQGDYMALDFQLPALDRNDLQTLRRAKVIAKIDDRGVAEMQDLAGQRTLAQDEIVIELVQTGSGLRPAANGWYFKEGEALRWSRAKYGEFRIDGQGRALLVNLRGPGLELL